MEGMFNMSYRTTPQGVEITHYIDIEMDIDMEMEVGTEKEKDVGLDVVPADERP